MLFRLAVAVAAAVIATVRSTVTDCSVPSAPFKISRLALRPDPPVSGQTVALDLEFTNTGPDITPANAGIAATSISINGLPYSDAKPLCEDTACPIVSGFNNRTSETTWPDVTGKVVSTIRWTDAANAELLCIQTTVRVGASPRLRARAMLYAPHYYHLHSVEEDDNTTCPLLPYLPSD